MWQGGESQIKSGDNLSAAPILLSPRNRVTNSGHAAISNDDSGVQTTKVSRPSSLKLGRGQGKSERVNASEPLIKLRHVSISEIGLSH